MASDHTPNYGLNQWELTDKVVMKDFNADNAAIDAAIKAEADARAAADGAINTALGKKADKTALTAVQNSLNSEISNRKSAVESLTEQSKLHTILSHTQSGSATEITLDLSGVSWSQFRRVYFLILTKGSGSSRAGFNNMVNLFDFSNNSEDYCLSMAPLRNGGLKVSGLLTGSQVNLFKSTYTYNGLKNLAIICNSGSTIASGFKVFLYGEK